MATGVTGNNTTFSHWGDQTREFPVLSVFFYDDDAEFVCIYRKEVESFLDHSAGGRITYYPERKELYWHAAAHQRRMKTISR